MEKKVGHPHPDRLCGPWEVLLGCRGLEAGGNAAPSKAHLQLRHHKPWMSECPGQLWERSEASVNAGSPRGPFTVRTSPGR